MQGVTVHSSYVDHSTSSRPRASPAKSRPSSVYTINTNRNSQTASTLLYDLPSPTKSPGLASPTSAISRSPSRGQSNRRPSGGVPAEDLEKFAEHCHAWYFDQVEEEGRQMTQTLASLPASQRAPFVRVQAAERSAFHASVSARRHAEFKAHLSATFPGQSLLPAARSDPKGSNAQHERRRRFERFVNAWCTTGYPGTKPFFEALWAVMRLQMLPETLGGAGPSRIEWEIDDAVFKEAAGKDFMLEAIDVLKGVLGFEERQSIKESPMIPNLEPASHLRAASQPLLSGERSSPISSTTIPPRTRARAPSNPFLDVTINSQTRSPSPTPADSSPEENTITFNEGDPSHMRTWTAPDLTNPEWHGLVGCFPASVTRRQFPRFIVHTRAPDLEEGLRGEGKEVCFGTGSMWVGAELREAGYMGSMWTRFVLWMKRLFS